MVVTMRRGKQSTKDFAELAFEPNKLEVPSYKSSQVTEFLATIRKWDESGLLDAEGATLKQEINSARGYRKI